MSRQDTIKQLERGIKQQQELLRVQKETGGFVHDAHYVIEHTESVIRMLEQKLAYWRNYKEPTRAEWLQDALSSISRMTDSTSPRYVALRERYQSELDALQAA